MANCVVTFFFKHVYRSWLREMTKFTVFFYFVDIWLILSVIAQFNDVLTLTHIILAFGFFFFLIVVIVITPIGRSAINNCGRAPVCDPPPFSSVGPLPWKLFDHHV